MLLAGFGGYILLFALNIWVFVIRQHNPWYEKRDLVSKIIGVYTFVFGVMVQTNFFEFITLGMKIQ